MSECVCEATLLGREPIQGTANADSLASLIRLLTRRAAGSAARRYRLRCSGRGIEIRPARRSEDEGFESDDDSVSQTSSDSNSSSCFLVEDHVLKYPGARVSEPTGPSSVATDSANSSGASDNDDGDNSLTTPSASRQPPAAVLPQKPKKSSTSVDDCLSREFYAFNDIAFCHTDNAFPKVLVLVIKKKLKIKKDEVDSATGLEAVVFQCKSVENLRDVCSSYKEFSRRLKMDLHFRYPHRRKDSTTETPSNTLYKNVFNDLQKSMSHSSATPSSPFFKTWITHVSSKPQASGKEVDFQSLESNKYNLVQRTDDDGVTHIEVSKATDDGFSTALMSTDEYSGSSSIISISTPDIGNLFVSATNQNQHSSSKGKDISSEIEGVICADIDSSPIAEKTYKTNGDTESVESDLKKPSSRELERSSNDSEVPPQRPQRGKYVKKNAPKQSERRQSDIKSKPDNGKEKSSSSRAPTPDSTKQAGTHERVVRGQFIRVNVEQQALPSARTGHRLFSGENEPPGKMLSYPAWNLPPDKELTKRAHRSREDETDYRSSSRGGKSYQRRSRSTGGGGNGRRSTSPPVRPPPLAYRFIDATPRSKPLSNRFFGKLKEIANLNGAYVGTLSRRRNSSGDLSTAQFYHYLEPALKTSVSKSTTNLKSVIKKKNCNENIEPKKVTFSAYATVQVVD